ncbi:MAG: AcrB/AcrD/AcrF family protein [Acidobacteria bacterium]|nr:MAG: AcrB/AcrD/AcrF family protein [Acidobacteriota bacterium]REJ98236.1 MAG: AcrB/AcrD/AcrF family protein [Acidobacteriota bacterium]REK16980.1 MAG: AcrB/AcrD/AcrF family protein [Acidobacteriota bacterium]REK42890.1 MAG: AcrB/AcrD/AcrF family protein [Acidobacteriota bacterium]
MINALIKFSISQRLIILLLVAIMSGAGIYSLLNLPIDAVPDVTNVQVQVLTAAPSLAPLEIERQVTFPVETAMSGLPDVEEIRSVSKFGLSAVTIVFDESVDIYFARQLVLERLSQAREQIPETIGSPEMGPISTGLGEIYQYELKAKDGSGYDATELRTIQDWNVRRQLMGVPGITEINSFGGYKKQYQVRLDPDKLQSYGLTIRDVYEAVAENNNNVGGAYVEKGSEQYLLRGIGLVEKSEDIKNIVIKTGREGVPVYVRDVGEVVEGAAVRQGAVTADGKGEIVAGIAMMLKGENSRAVANNIKERVEEVKKSLPEGVELITFYDRTELVDRAIATVEKNLVEGALFVIVVLLLLLGNWRGALLVATIIPLSMLFAAILMRVFNVSGNLMSLGALDFGLIVDGAVVMVENAVRRRAEAQHENSSEPPERTILEACQEVARPVVFAVAIIAIVYLPILSLRGIEGKMFVPMALTVVFALLGSLILSLTYVPAMLTFVLKGKVSENESFLIRWAKKIYKPAFGFTMRYRSQGLAVAVSLVFISGAIFSYLGAEFIPRLDEGDLAVQVQQLPSVSLNQSIKTVSEVEKVLMEFPEVRTVISKTGRAEVATDPMGIDFSDLYVGLKPPDEWTTTKDKTELVEKMSHELEKRVPNAQVSFSQPIELRVAELISGVRSDVAIKLFGDDLDVLKEKADEIVRVVQTIPGAEDVKAETTSGLPQLQIKPDRAAIARYGLNITDVNDLVETIVAGKETGQVFEGEQRFDLVVRLEEDAGKSVDTVKNLLLTAPNGSRVPLSEVAEIKLVEGAAQITREDTRRRIGVELNVRGRDIASFVAEAQEKIEKQVNLPPGYYLTWGGTFENLQRASERLLIVVPIALFLIFVLLFTTFNSIKQALLVYTGIPFAIVGGVFALLLRGMPFSISAGVGFIALFGVAVLNGVVMVSYINYLRKEGEPVLNAVKEGAETRLRPVLMTALVASLGFIPMALATSAGAEVQRPLATVVIGGLITSTLLTLLILPTLYAWFEKDPEGVFDSEQE